MPTPLAHGVAAWAAARTADPETLSARQVLALAAFLAIAPDLDFLVGALVGQPDSIHRGATHSLVGASLASWALAWVLSRAAGRGATRSRGTGWWFAIVMPTWCVHIALDLVVPDTNGAAGMRLLWPFSNEFVGMPLPLPAALRAFIDLDTGDGSFGFAKALLSARGLAVLLLEGLAFTPLLLAPRLMGSVRHRLGGRRGETLGFAPPGD